MKTSTSYSSGRRDDRRNPTTGILLACILVPWTLANWAPTLSALEVRPAEPRICDPVQLRVTRTFNQDCGWSVSEQVEISDGTLLVRLTPRAASEICLQVIRDETFVIELGQLPEGPIRIAVEWTDEVPGESIEIEVSRTGCDPVVGMLRGDANSDGKVDLTDTITTLAILLLGDPAPCFAACDSDASGEVDITDAIFTLARLFLGGLSPPPPYPECGILPDGFGELSCRTPQCGDLSGETLWMARPDGCMQCEPCIGRSLREVVDSLLVQGFEILDSRQTAIGVCEACTICPSGIIHNILVPGELFETLAHLGWRRAEEIQGN